MNPETTIHVRTPTDLVDVVPFLIGFHPSDSLVVIGLDSGRIMFCARYDLPAADDRDFEHLASVVRAQAADVISLVGYGPAEVVDDAMLKAVAAMPRRVLVHDALRVHEKRWWSYLCGPDGCCEPGGNPCNEADSVIAARATYLGHVALPSRAVLVAQVAPVEGEQRAAMTTATARARERLNALLSDDSGRRRPMRHAGRFAIREAENRYRKGSVCTDDEIAWLGVLLVDPDINDYAMSRSGGAQPWRLTLWQDVFRRVDPTYATAPGCLLGYTAWRAGEGALARVAIDRVLMSEPHYRMAGLLDDVLGYGISPQAMTGFDHLKRRPVSPFRTMPDSMSSGGAPGSPARDDSRPSQGRGSRRTRGGGVPRRTRRESEG